VKKSGCKREIYLSCDTNDCDWSNVQGAVSRICEHAEFMTISNFSGCIAILLCTNKEAQAQALFPVGHDSKGGGDE
jgi:hypothetical protein